jgi:NAD+ kinase
MLKRLGLMGNQKKSSVLPLCEKIISWCFRHEIKVHIDENLSPLLSLKRKKNPLVEGALETCDLICIMGGDGYLLYAVREIYPHQIPLLPVNLGSFGFNAQIEPGETLKTLSKIHREGIKSSKRYLLDVTPPGRLKQNSEVALNDVLLIKEVHSRLIHIEVMLDGMVMGNVPCDGMIVSTPTGATAYNFSAGGPLAHPSLPIMIIIPLCAHTMTSRPIILPSASDIRLRFIPLKDREEALSCIDGQVWWTLQPGDEVRIAMTKKPVLIADVNPQNYFSKLKTRFQWGKSLTRNES